MERKNQGLPRHSWNSEKSEVIGAATAPQRDKREEVTNIKYKITCNGKKTIA